MQLPEFQTERLILRPRITDDLEACLTMDRDPEVTRFVDGPWQEPEKHRAFVLSRMQADYPAGMGYWTVSAKTAPDRFLGWILLLPYSAVADEVEIGWRFVRDRWGHGYATEAAAAILDHAVYTLGLENVVADIHPGNLGSIRVAEKIGLALRQSRQLDDVMTKSYQLPSLAR